MKIESSDIISIEDHYYYHRVHHINGSFYFVNLINQLPSLKNDLRNFSLNKEIEDKSEEGLFKPVKHRSWIERILICSVILAGLSIFIKVFVQQHSAQDCSYFAACDRGRWTIKE